MCPGLSSLLLMVVAEGTLVWVGEMVWMQALVLMPMVEVAVVLVTI